VWEEWESYKEKGMANESPLLWRFFLNFQKKKTQTGRFGQKARFSNTEIKGFRPPIPIPSASG